MASVRRDPDRRGWLRARRGAGTIEYAIMIFLVLVAGFLAYKYLGGEVQKSTKASGKTFQEGDSKSSGGQAAQGGGAGQQPAGGAPAPEKGKVATGGGAKVSTVPTTGGPVDVGGAGGKHARAAEEEGSGRPRNWVRLLIIVIVVLGAMAAIFQAGKKGKKAAS